MLDTQVSETRFMASRSSGAVSAILKRPKRAAWLMVLGHGAGAGMRHRFMESLADTLAAQQIASFRYQFPYMEQGKRAPSPRPILMATVRSAVAAARAIADDLPLLAGGKSMGGRMTSIAAAAEPLAGVRGLVFFGFPLHAPGRSSAERADHLSELPLPMLFLQGTRDKLANLELLRPVSEKLAGRATLHLIDGADHSFHMLKRSGRSDEDALTELAATVRTWSSDLI